MYIEVLRQLQSTTQVNYHYLRYSIPSMCEKSCVSIHSQIRAYFILSGFFLQYDLLSLIQYVQYWIVFTEFTCQEYESKILLWKFKHVIYFLAQTSIIKVSILNFKINRIDERYHLFHTLNFVYFGWLNWVPKGPAYIFRKRLKW